MGQGDPGGQHQGRLTGNPIQYSVTSVRRMSDAPPRGLGDRMPMLFAAVHESGCGGAERTYRGKLTHVRVRDEADLASVTE